MSNGNDLKRTHAQFTYLKCMIMCFNEEEMKKRKKQEKEDEKRKSTSIFLIAK